MGLPTRLDMRLAATTWIASTVRRFAQALYQRVLHDDDASSRLALATHELLENAVRHGADDVTDLHVTLTPTEASPDVAVTIATRNRATAANIDAAQQAIARVREAADPFAFHQQQIHAALAGAGGLGLARIRSETDMTLDARVDGDALEVVASVRVRRGGAT